MTKYFRPDDVDWPVFSRRAEHPHVTMHYPVRVGPHQWPVVPIVVGFNPMRKTCANCMVRTERASEQIEYDLPMLGCFDLPDCSGLYWLRGSEESLALWVANQMEKPNEEI